MSARAEKVKSIQIQYANSCLVYYVAHLDPKADWQVAIHVPCSGDFLATAHGLQEYLSCAVPEQNKCMYCQYTSIYCILAPCGQTCSGLGYVRVGFSHPSAGSNHEALLVQPLCRGYELPGSAEPGNLEINMLLFLVMLSCSYISWVCHLSCVCQLNVVWFCHALSCLHATNARLQEKEKLRNNSKKLEEKLQLLALSGRIANADLKQKRNDFQNRTIIEIFWLCFTCRAPQKINVRKTDN